MQNEARIDSTRSAVPALGQRSGVRQRGGPRVAPPCRHRHGLDRRASPGRTPTTRASMASCATSAWATSGSDRVPKPRSSSKPGAFTSTPFDPTAAWTTWRRRSSSSSITLSPTEPSSRNGWPELPGAGQ